MLLAIDELGRSAESAIAKNSTAASATPIAKSMRKATILLPITAVGSFMGVAGWVCIGTIVA